MTSIHGSPKELIINEKIGFLTRFGDLEELKEKIANILSEDSKKKGKFVREHVKKYCS